MRIAYFTDSFYPRVDGVTTYIGVITRELIKQGHEVMIVAPRLKGTNIIEVQKFVPGAKLVLVPGVKPFFYPDLSFGAPTPRSISQVTGFHLMFYTFTPLLLWDLKQPCCPRY